LVKNVRPAGAGSKMIEGRTEQVKACELSPCGGKSGGIVFDHSQMFL
jgi:hypothetical protein